MGGTTLEVTTTRHEGCTVVAAAGQADMDTSGALDQALRAALSQGPTVLDLSRVSFMDSRGLHTVIRAHFIATDAQIPLVVVPSPKVTSLLEVTDLHILTVSGCVPDALDAALSRV